MQEAGALFVVLLGFLLGFFLGFVLFCAGRDIVDVQVVVGLRLPILVGVVQALRPDAP